MKSKTLGLLAVGLLAWPYAATASVILYTDEAAFAAATSSLTTIDFEGLPEQYLPAPLTVSGATFQMASSGFLFLTDDYFDSLGLSAQRIPNGGGILVTFAGPITAFGADLAFISPPIDRRMTFALSNGDSISFAAGTSLSFVGVTSNATFSWLGISAPDGARCPGCGPNLDNVRFGAASASASVPEPGTLALLGLGLAGLGLSRRRKAA